MATEVTHKIRITLVESKAGNTARHAKNLLALGLRKRHQTVEHLATPDILGKVHYVKHMVSTELVPLSEGPVVPRNPAKTLRGTKQATVEVVEEKPKATRKKKADTTETEGKSKD